MERPADNELRLVLHALHLQLAKIVQIIAAVAEENEHATGVESAPRRPVHLLEPLLDVERLLDVEVEGEEEHAHPWIQLEIFHDCIRRDLEATIDVCARIDDAVLVRFELAERGIVLLQPADFDQVSLLVALVLDRPGLLDVDRVLLKRGGRGSGLICSRLAEAPLLLLHHRVCCLVRVLGLSSPLGLLR